MLVSRNAERPVGLFPLWFGLLGGPAGWTAHLLLSYPLVPLACATGLRLILHAVTLVTVGIIVAAAVVAWRSWQRLGAPNGGGDGAELADRWQGFMALSGVLLSLLFLFVTLAEGLPVFFHDPCVGV